VDQASRGWAARFGLPDDPTHSTILARNKKNIININNTSIFNRLNIIEKMLCIDIHATLTKLTFNSRMS
jgi:hypothetical protein